LLEHTEKLRQSVIEKLAKQRTALIIPHRLSTIRNAHKIIVLKNGEIIEVGTHVELSKVDGYYRKMLEGNVFQEVI